MHGCPLEFVIRALSPVCSAQETELALKSLRKIRLSLESKAISTPGSVSLFKESIHYLNQKINWVECPDDSLLNGMAQYHLSSTQFLPVLDSLLLQLNITCQKFDSIYLVVDGTQTTYFKPSELGSRPLTPSELFDCLDHPNSFAPLNRLNIAKDLLHQEYDFFSRIKNEEASFFIMSLIIQVDPFDLRYRFLRGKLYFENNMNDKAFDDLKFYADSTDPTLWSREFHFIYNQVNKSIF